MNPGAQKIYNSFSGKVNTGGRRFSDDGGASREFYNNNPPVDMPEDKTVDTKKTLKFQNSAKYAVYGGVFGIVGAIVLGKGIVRYGLLGAGIGFAIGLFLGKEKMPENKDDAKELLNEILAASGTLTESGKTFLKNEYAKLKNSLATSKYTADGYKAAQEKLTLIQDKLKNAGVLV